MKHRLVKPTGLKKRWMLSSVSISVVLVIFAVLLFSLSIGIYYYSNVLADLRAKAETSTGFFKNYISQDYQNFYQSCVRFAQSFGESDVLELQFISPMGNWLQRPTDRGRDRQFRHATFSRPLQAVMLQVSAVPTPEPGNILWRSPAP